MVTTDSPTTPQALLPTASFLRWLSVYPMVSCRKHRIIDEGIMEKESSWRKQGAGVMELDTESKDHG